MKRLSIVVAGLCLLAGLAVEPGRADVPTAASAQAAFDRGDFDQARKAYEEQIKTDPNSVTLPLDLTRTLLRMDRWRDALRVAKAESMAAPQSADAAGLLALSEMRAGQPEAALSDAQRALSLDRDNYWGLIAEGRVADWDGRKKAAQDDFNRAAALHPERPEAYLGLWRSADETRLGEAEIAAATKYLSLDPKGVPFDSNTHFIRSFVENEVEYWRSFEKDPPFHVNGPAKQPEKADSFTTTFPIQREGEYVFVTAQIDGQPFHLLFDTGADDLLLSEKAAHRLHLTQATRSLIGGVQGESGASRQRAETLALGSLTFHSIPVTVAKLDGDLKDGIFGGPLLSDYAITFDFVKSTMTLSAGAGAGYVPRPDTVSSSVPLHVFESDFFVSAEANGRQAWAILDTGAETAFFSLALTRELSAKTSRTEWQEGSTDSRSGIGDTAKRFEYCLTPTEVKITFPGSDQVLNQVGLNGESNLDRQISPDSDFEIGMLLGIPWLNQHSRVTIDYPNRLLTFEDPQ